MSKTEGEKMEELKTIKEYLLLRIEADLQKQEFLESQGNYSESNYTLGKVKAYQNILGMINAIIENK